MPLVHESERECGWGERRSHQVGKMRTECRQTGAGKLGEEEVNGRMSTAREK